MTFTVAITGVTNPVEIYAGTTAIADYVGAMLGPGAAAFRGLSPDDKARVAVSCTRYVDGWAWQGAAALSGTTLQFPRTGLLDENGSPIASDVQLAAVAQAVCELAALVAQDPTILTAADQGSNLQAMGAGPARIQFFRPTSAQDGNATLLPTVVDRLIGNWLAVADPAIEAAASGVSHGTSSHSDFDGCSSMNLNWPL